MPLSFYTGSTCESDTSASPPIHRYPPKPTLSYIILLAGRSERIQPLVHLTPSDRTATTSCWSHVLVHVRDSQQSSIHLRTPPRVAQHRSVEVCLVLNLHFGLIPVNTFRHDTTRQPFRKRHRRTFSRARWSAQDNVDGGSGSGCEGEDGRLCRWGGQTSKQEHKCRTLGP